MRIIKILVIALILVSCNTKTNTTETQKEYTQFVNTFIGTDGTGHTFPGPCIPFGMVQPGPDNTSGVSQI